MARQAKRAKTERIPVNKREGFVKGSQSAQGSAAKAPVELTEDQREQRRERRMFKRRASKVLFFINGAMPTEAEYATAEAIGPGAVFRNARKIVPGAPLENCDAVAGEVPDDYKIFPMAEDDMKVDPNAMPEGIVSRPERGHAASSPGNGPDDVRPGTVDTGMAHLSGTGSSKPGGIDNLNAPGAGEPPDGTVTNETPRSQADEWKSNKLNP